MRHFNLYLWRGVGVLTIMALFVFGSGNDIMAKEYPTLYRGVRPLGMGGAFTAVADDENALFYNPAGLSKISTFSIAVINPLIEASENGYALYQDITTEDLDDTGEAADLLRKYVGEHEHFRVALTPYAGFNVAKVGVMVSGLAQGTFDAEIRNPAWPEAHLDIVADYGLLAGGGIELPITGLSVGVALKYINRQSLSEVYTATDIAASDFEQMIEDDLESGAGVSADIGAMYKLSFIPIVDTQVALAVQNIPDMGMGDALDIKSQVNFGLAVEKSLKIFSIIGAIDYLDIGSNVGEDDDIPKRLHFGVEAKLPTILSVRLGLNQGYLTAGVTVDIWLLRLDLATYGEEVGAYAGQRDDRRWVGQISLGW